LNPVFRSVLLIFFAIATLFLVLPFMVELVETPDTVHVLG
jgi:hypothetical protein